MQSLIFLPDGVSENVDLMLKLSVFSHSFPHWYIYVDAMLWMSFQLEMARHYHEHKATLLLLCRASFQQMAQQAPKLLNLLQTIILRSTCLSVAHALEALERSGMD